jgi:hypothetical protein
MSSTRTGYTALTPEFADFAIPHTPAPSATSSRLREALPETQHHKRLDAAWSRARSIVKNNTGLLLVASSQAFFSSMNVAVKILNGIDPPVSTFEVCCFARVPGCHADNELVDCCAHGRCSAHRSQRPSYLVSCFQGITYVCSITYM